MLILILMLASVLGNQALMYKQRTSGKCGDSGGGWGYITSAAACGAGAAALGWTDTTAAGASVGWSPSANPGSCFRHSNGNLGFMPISSVLCSSTYQCLCTHEDQAPVYKQRTSGKCGDSGGGWGYITSAVACGAGAAALGWTDTTAYTTSSSYVPPECSIGSNYLYFNTRNSNYACSSDYRCLCTLTCPPGKHQYQSGQSSCKTCASGQYQAQTGKSSCKTCPDGQYQDQSGKSSCKTCASGQYQSLPGQPCVSCPVGQYQDKEKQSSCKTCPDGQYQDQSGKSSCKTCASGQYQSLPSQPCVSCPVGQYQDKEKQSSCVSCPGGQYQDQERQSSCVSCPAGFYQDGETSVNCKACIGSKEGANTCVELADLPVDMVKEAYTCGHSTLVTCGAGRRWNGAGCSTCTPIDTVESVTCTTAFDSEPVCPAGDYKTGQTCSGCAEGKYSLSGASTCSACTPIDNCHGSVADISCGGTACVARMINGTAVAWGLPDYGGDIRCTSVDCTPLPGDIDLTDVADISCGGKACVARKHNGDAYAWGGTNYGGDASSVDLTTVADISCGGNACVARMINGTAVVWGNRAKGGDIRCRNIPSYTSCNALPAGVDLTDVADISCGTYACVARKNDNTAYAWGHPDWGGNAPSLTDVADISCGGRACVARMINGTAVAWGDQDWGGDASSVDLTDVADISCGGRACVARKTDDTAYAWGYPDWGGNAPSLTDVVDISCGDLACVARMINGTAVAWGDQDWGGDASSVDLTYVVDISCGGSACVARMINTAVAWGGADWGGDAPPLTDVADISCGEYTCAARMKDGTVVAWGSASRGGDASHISFFPGCSLSSPAQLRAMNNQCPV